MIKVNCPYCKRLTSWQVKFLERTSILGCKFCQIGFQYPLPKKAEIKNYYQDTIYTKVWGDPFGPFKAMKQKTYRRILKHLPSNASPKTFLDIGCGYGLFLPEAQQQGMKAIGIEPSPALAKIASQVSKTKVKNGFFNDSKIIFNEQFDIVAMIDVIEHFQNPWQALEKALSLVKAGQFLILTTPDFSSPSRKILGKFWPHFKNEHYFYLSGFFLKKYLPKKGFRLLTLVSQPRVYSLNYLENHFQTYPIPLFSVLLSFVLSYLPRHFKKQTFFVPGPLFNGNLLLIAQKEENDE